MELFERRGIMHRWNIGLAICYIHNAKINLLLGKSSQLRFFNFFELERIRQCNLVHTFLLVPELLGG